LYFHFSDTAFAAIPGGNMKRDFFCGLFVFSFGLIIWLTIPYTIPHIDRLSHMGPRFFPTFFSIGLTALGFLLSLQALTNRASWKKEPPKDIFVMKDEIPVLVTYLIMTGACILFVYFRYIISMTAAVTVMLIIYKERKWYNYLIMYAFIALFYFIFANIMHVQL
jgi:hypothetical protein